MAASMKWTLDGKDFPYEVRHTTFTQTSTTRPEGQFTLQQEIVIVPSVQFNEKDLVCHVRKEDGLTVETLPSKIVLNLKIEYPDILDAQEIDVLEGEHQISWNLARTKNSNSVKPKMENCPTPQESAELSITTKQFPKYPSGMGK